ncbi:hypothetical protein EVJ58_g5000 [Rhodofomes roseus]|uniref:Uncharacterized protein n=1 Tax=Rhodofomes roseus TaxID=34475 RepID=A0A4Y9YDP8_9APHY|nr:hypothetical protein EVJ58_g5000 [Rhodofomes roseus]
MEWLNNPSLASNPVWPSSSYEQDHLAMRRLYKAMYDGVILKASTQYIVIQPEA